MKRFMLNCGGVYSSNLLAEETDNENKIINNKGDA